MLRVHDGPPSWVRPLFEVGVKLAGDAEPEVSYGMAGTLYLANTNWLLLTVPNAVVRGVFSAMSEPGVELPPPGPGGTLNAHITVMRPEELDQIGGADRVTERGKQFHYTVSRLYSMAPDGWPNIAKVWFLRVHSPELQQLRRSYGLSSLPGDGKNDFHVTVAVRHRGVLGRNDTGKAA